ncbi:rho GTPase-activating protein 45 [Podargus strigoides]
MSGMKTLPEEHWGVREEAPWLCGAPRHCPPRACAPARERGARRGPMVPQSLPATPEHGHPSRPRARPTVLRAAGGGMLGRVGGRRSYSPCPTGRHSTSRANAPKRSLDSLPHAPTVWLTDLSRKDCLEAPSSSLGELPPSSAKLSTSPSAVGTLKRPTSLSRHASAAGFPLTAAGPRAVPKGHKTPTSYSPLDGGEGLFIDTEDISQLLTDVARFADALENLRDVVLRDGECRLPPLLPTQCPTTRHGAAGHWDHRVSISSLGTDQTRGSGSLPQPGGDGDPRGPCPAVAAVGRGCAAVPVACQGPQSPAGHQARPPDPRAPSPASSGRPAGRGRCPGADAGLGGLRGRGRVSLPKEKGTVAVPWSPRRVGVEHSSAGQGGNTPEPDGDRPTAIPARGPRLLLDVVWDSRDEGVRKWKREWRKPLPDPELWGLAQLDSGCQAPIPARPYRRLLTSSPGCQHRALAPALAPGWQLQPAEGTGPGKDLVGRVEPGWMWHGGRTDLPHPRWWLGAPGRRGGGEGNEEEIPKLLSREKVTAEEKMPDRLGSPRPTTPGTARAGEPRNQGDGRGWQGADPTEPQRPLAHECLGETLRILRQVINKYPLLNTLETLTAAGTLISKVKGFHYESDNETDKREFEKAVETIAVSFSSTVSEFLMGEVDSSTILSIPPSDQNQSMESLYGGIPAPGGEGMPSGMESYDTARPPAEEVDVLLQRCEGGVDAALHYAKTISKYMKDLTGYLEKRTTLEMEFAKGLQKMANSCKQTISQESNMPFLSIYLLALEQDMEHGTSVLQAATTLQHQTFLQPLAVRRLEHEKRRKEIKEQWHRAQRKLQEAEANLRKAKQTYMQRSEEHDKAKHVAARAEEEQQSTTGSITTKTLDKKRRLEEEAKNKAEEAMATYRTCVADANTQKQELEDTKVNSLRQIHEVIKQSDQVIKTATISFYQIMHMQTAPLPVNFQTLCESSKLYDPGQQYASHVRQLQRGDEPDTQYDFEPYVSHSAWSPFTRTRKGSFSASDFASAGSEGAALPKDGTGSDGGAGAKEPPSERRGGRGHQVHKSWPTSATEADSSLDSNAGEFSHKLQRLSSNGTVSSGEELEEKEESATPFEQSINGISAEMTAPTGPFRNVGLSKAAQTHRLRKLRAPSKCRECNSYVYFQGAECEECYLACHKKCLETLAIQCGHKKLQGKLQLFGQDFTKASQSSSDGIPFIVKKCVSEIEKRALKTKGIYRVNGVKTRVEKLCQAFENGKELVELSQASPHDISNVLKLYLRQLPEPLMPFRLYNELVGLAKESLQGGEAKGKGGRGGPELVDKGADTDKVVVSLVLRLKELLKELPWENMATLQYLLQHLRRIVEVEQDNKMTSSNLGIVFGPTLMRPRPTDATISLSSLVDYPHQARIVEALIIFYSTIFEKKDAAALAEPSKHTAHSTEGAPGCPDLASAGPQPAAPPGTVSHLQPPSDTQNLGYGADSFAESGDRSVDSDSELEDGGELLAAVAAGPRARLTKQESETSTDEAQLCEEGSEGQRSRSCSTGQSDAEGPAPRCRSPPGAEQSDAE